LRPSPQPLSLLSVSSPQSAEAAAEAALRAKYGGLLPKKRVALPTDHKFFDSADWALSKAQDAQQAQQAARTAASGPLGMVQPCAPGGGGLPPGLPTGASQPTMLAPPPKLEPSEPPGPRRPSHLGEKR
jgi:hypothetical protein